MFGVSFKIFLYLVIVSTASCKLIESDEQLKLRDLKRTTECVGTGEQCYNTEHCCNDLVCATLNNNIGERPEMPGYCVKSKDLRSCVVGNDDCPTGNQCVMLGRGDVQGYCVERNVDMDTSEIGVHHGKKLGGLGSACKTTKDCQAMNESQTKRLCCQHVPRGRQGVKRLCDPITAVSVCIFEP